jgi:hypothetical protein
MKETTYKLTKAQQIKIENFEKKQEKELSEFLEAQKIQLEKVVDSYKREQAYAKLKNKAYLDRLLHIKIWTSNDFVGQNGGYKHFKLVGEKINIKETKKQQHANTLFLISLTNDEILALAAYLNITFEK